MTAPAPATAQTAKPGQTIITYAPRGGALALMRCRDREVLLDGPANTGKSYAALWKVHYALQKYPGARALLLRKTLVSLKASTLVTYRERVLHPGYGVRFWTAKGDEPAHYAYPNGSKLVIGGMDKPGKIMSTEYDLVFWDEATDGTVDEWEALTTRLRYGKMPYQQAIACVNPQQPHHWLNERANSGRMARILSRHEDNPAVTPEYLAALDALTGVRRARLYLGIWAAAEGGIYEDYWDAKRHLVNRFDIPRDWTRYLVVDFGFTHPFVCQWWAEDNDGRLYRYREVYRSKVLVQQHAETIKRASGWDVAKSGWEMLTKSGDPLPAAIICDPEDAEARAQLEKFLGLKTVAANKAVATGIQAVQARLQPRGDGTSGMLFLRDSLVGERDPLLQERRLPCCTEEEIEGYVWDTRHGQKRGDVPLKENDHGCDAARYMAMYRDFGERGVTYGADIWAE